MGKAEPESGVVADRARYGQGGAHGRRDQAPSPLPACSPVVGGDAEERRLPDARPKSNGGTGLRRSPRGQILARFGYSAASATGLTEMKVRPFRPVWKVT